MKTSGSGTMGGDLRCSWKVPRGPHGGAAPIFVSGRDLPVDA